MFFSKAFFIANRYQQDRLGLKIAVFVLAILTTLKSIHIFALVWVQSINYFTDLEGAIGLSYTAWWQSGSPLIIATLDLYVQVFFVRRLYFISGKKWWVAAPIGVVLAFAYAAMCLATYYITVGASATPLMAPWFAAHFGSVVGGDICMTFAMTYFLLKTRKEVLPQTVGLFTALIRLTWLSAAPATICAVLNLTLSQIWPGTERLLSVTFGTILPKLYAMSMMWTLNARMDIRAANTKRSTGALVLSDTRSPGAIQPTGISTQGIQVQMLTETTRQTDAYEMYHTHTPDAEFSAKSVYLVVPDIVIPAIVRFGT
ncbi:hypothetical protein NP233_g6379 [Leucocoprinus birnbaumii]|uniref:DUF6534 domain-containing protein n=1 Tax=Leucocoprinus birnbaumii TaxID=56174 RepID=A0AAD5VR98_9AGAR|nr:hypothetical protein NP233_g6379 [Leucocoprinus birnbaumii]